MKTVTYEQFLEFEPCWLGDGRAEKLAKIGARKKEWTAVDILKLRGVSIEDKFWAVLREEFIDAPVLHEFACRCAEHALTIAGIKDDGSNASWNAIHTKRLWVKGEATDEQLKEARAAARDAARAAARDAAWAASWDAARYAAWYAAGGAARDAADAAWYAAYAYAADAAWYAAWDAERSWQEAELIKMLKEAGWSE